MKDIPGYEGAYAVTEEGRVWSYPRLGREIGGFLYTKEIMESIYVYF